MEWWFELQHPRCRVFPLQFQLVQSNFKFEWYYFDCVHCDFKFIWRDFDMDSLIFELQIVFYFQLFLSANVRHRTPWVMPPTTSLLRYEPITIHPLPPSYFKFFFSPLSFKTCFAYVVYNDKKLVCFTPGIEFFLNNSNIYLLVSLKVELRRIPYMTYKKSISLPAFSHHL